MHEDAFAPRKKSAFVQSGSPSISSRVLTTRARSRADIGKGTGNLVRVCSNKAARVLAPALGETSNSVKSALAGKHDSLHSSHSASIVTTTGCDRCGTSTRTK
jgi:hypothetical protein